VGVRCFDFCSVGVVATWFVMLLRGVFMVAVCFVWGSVGVWCFIFCVVGWFGC